MSKGTQSISSTRSARVSKVRRVVLDQVVRNRDQDFVVVNENGSRCETPVNPKHNRR
jgi:hypothetical protein